MLTFRRIQCVGALVACAMATVGCDRKQGSPVQLSGPFLLEAPVFGSVGFNVLIELPAGTWFQNGYVTAPNAEMITNVAWILEEDENAHVISVRCANEGSAWVRVKTNTGYWKIYPLTCEHDQGGGN